MAGVFYYQFCYNCEAGLVAHLVERLIRIEEVRGSIPLKSTSTPDTLAVAGVVCLLEWYNYAVSTQIYIKEKRHGMWS